MKMSIEHILPGTKELMTDLGTGGSRVTFGDAVKLNKDRIVGPAAQNYHLPIPLRLKRGLASSSNGDDGSLTEL